MRACSDLYEAVCRVSLLCLLRKFGSLCFCDHVYAVVGDFCHGQEDGVKCRQEVGIKRRHGILRLNLEHLLHRHCVRFGNFTATG